jgi:hypothetical protein
MMQQLNASTAIVKAMLKSKDLFVFHSGTRAWDKRLSVVGVTKGTQTVLKVTGGFLHGFNTTMAVNLSDFVGMEEANGQEVYVGGVDWLTNELTVNLDSSTFSDYQYGWRGLTDRCPYLQGTVRPQIHGSSGIYRRWSHLPPER